jgi:energy-coupling factor transport system permease protein
MSMILEERGRLNGVDPRAKIVWLLATLVAGLVFVNVGSLVVVLLSIALVALAGGVLRETLKRLRGLGMIVVVIGLIFGLTVPGTTLFYLLPPGLPLIGGHLAVSAEGLFLGLVSVLRMFVFATPLLIIIMTTNNSDLLQGLMWFRLPPDYALMITLALNFVPVLLQEIERIADAQKARAHSLVDQGLVGRMRGMIPIFIPLTLNAVDRADTIGKVLEMRGFARRKLRVEFEPFDRGSWVLLALSVAAVTGRDALAEWVNFGR